MTDKENEWSNACMGPAAYLTGTIWMRAAMISVCGLETVPASVYINSRLNRRANRCMYLCQTPMSKQPPGREMQKTRQVRKMRAKETACLDK